MAGYSDLQALQVQRVVSNLAAGVRLDQGFIAEEVLPAVNVGSMNFAYSTWGNEGLRLVETRRGLNGEPNEVNLSSSTATGELEDHSIATRYDLLRVKSAEEAGNGDMFRASHAGALRSLVAIQKEKAVADIVFAAGNYTGATSSSVGFSATGIRDTFLAAKDTQEQKIGARLNVFVLGSAAYRHLLKNSDIMNTIQYSRGGITRLQTLAEYFEVDKVLVGRAAYQASAAAGAVGTVTNLWTIDSAALIRVDSDANMQSPCFGKLFYMNAPDTGSRSYAATWRPDPQINEHMIYREFFKPATVMTAAGYLWTNADQ